MPSARNPGSGTCEVGLTKLEEGIGVCYMKLRFPECSQRVLEVTEPPLPAPRSDSHHPKVVRRSCVYYISE